MNHPGMVFKCGRGKSRFDGTGHRSVIPTSSPIPDPTKSGPEKGSVTSRCHTRCRANCRSGKGGGAAQADDSGPPREAPHDTSEKEVRRRRFRFLPVAGSLVPLPAKSPLGGIPLPLLGERVRGTIWHYCSSPSICRPIGDPPAALTVSITRTTSP